MSVEEFKTKIYNNCKKDYTPSYYLDLTKKSNERKRLVKFQISNHNLMIEIDRYDQTPRKDRLCPTCGLDQIEDKFTSFSSVLNT